MARILCVGVATLDIIMELQQYPVEDSEQRARSCARQRGGNAANSAVVLAQFGHDVHWLGALADDANGDLILADLHRYGVQTDAVSRQPGVTPLSTIWRSANSGTRTIAHFRELDELSEHAFDNVNLMAFDWVHFEARHCAVTAKMMLQVKQQSQAQVSLEVEKTRPDIEHCLAQDVNLQIYSREYVMQSGFKQPDVFLNHASAAAATIRVCTWGEQGAYAQQGAGECIHVPAVPLREVVDSIGAGDTFNAGLIHALIQGRTLKAALAFANGLAACKCAQTGYAGLAQRLQAV